MREYIRPTMQGEAFAANEYVAVCWAIACDWGKMGGETGVHNENLPFWLRESAGDVHTMKSNGTGCGHLDNQFITEVSDGSFSVMEINTDGLGNLNTKLTTRDSYRGLQSTITDVKPGDEIYWVTSSGDRKWYHSGTVSTADFGHPNRS